jgi:ABC-type multidrug transport system fused ATPase/permease subunit
MRAFAALLSATWRYAKGHRGMLLFYASLFVGANVMILVEPIVIGQLLNTIQNITTIPDPFPRLTVLFACMLGIQFGFWAFHGPARTIENTVAFRAKIAFADRLFRIVTSLPVQWHKDHHSGQTINRMRKSTSALYDFMGNGYQIIEMILRLIGSIVAIFLLFPVAGLIAVTICIVAVTIVFLFDRVLLPQYDQINEREHFTASALHDYLTNVFTVISLRLEKLTRNELLQRMTSYFPLFQKNSVVNETKWFIATIVIAVMTVTTLAWYAWSMLGAGGMLLAGTVYMLYEYLQKIGASFYTFAWKYSQTVQQFADLKAVNEILAAAPAERSGAAALPEDWKTVAIQNLQFTYEDEDHRQHHLKDVSIDLERGKRIALVGESGSGKSTLMSLIRGLHVTDNVKVSCDGTHLPEKLKHLAQHATLIPQEPEIFSNTIEYNVSVDTKQSTEELLRDIEAACFTSVLNRLPKGLDTDISEKGVNLSGGEKQRLALARGIFAAKDSDIILLDEPTSSVDSMNELQIHKNIFARFPDRCIVASIHRLHLLPLFDVVYVLQNGNIVEHGKPNDLMKGTGLLGTMWKSYEQQREAGLQTP